MPVTGRRLLLLRHGRTSWNDAERAQGHADITLDDTGRAQAAAVAPYLAKLPPAALWSSDLARARETCGFLEEATGLSAKTDERLREFDVGERQGLTSAEFAARFPEAYVAWTGGDLTRSEVPGAETAADVAERMHPALAEALASLEPGETGIVVTHGAALKVGLAALLGWPADVSGTLGGVGNCCWVTLCEVEAGGRLRMLGYNEKSP